MLIAACPFANERSLLGDAVFVIEEDERADIAQCKYGDK